MSSIKKLRPFIGGDFRDSVTAKYTDAFDPSTGEVIASVPCCTSGEVEEAIASAKRAFEAWSITPVTKRVEVLYEVRNLINKNMEGGRRGCPQSQGGDGTGHIRGQHDAGGVPDGHVERL